MATEVRAIDALYPGALALGLVPLCGPHCDGNGHEDPPASGEPDPFLGLRFPHTPGKSAVSLRQVIAASVRGHRGDLGERAAHVEAIAQHVASGGNVGLALPSGVVALDADAESAVVWLEARLPKAPRHDTARGAHFLVRAQLALADFAAGVAVEPGIRFDAFIGPHLYVVVEPSVHASGAIYRWRRPPRAAAADLPEVPSEIVAALGRAIDVVGVHVRAAKKAAERAWREEIARREEAAARERALQDRVWAMYRREKAAGRIGVPRPARLS